MRRLWQGDATVAVVAAVLALIGRFGQAAPWQYIALTALVPFVWTLVLSFSNGYERRYLGVGTEEYRAVTRAGVVLFAVLAGFSFMADQNVARLYVAGLMLLLVTGSLAVRYAARQRLLRRRMGGALMQRTVVVGRADAVAALIRSIRSDPQQGLEPVAACVSGMDAEWDATSAIHGVPVMGPPGDAVGTADLLDAEVVAVASHPDLAGAALRRLAWALEERQIELIVAPGLLDVAGPRLSIRPSTNLSLLHIERPAASRRTVLLKGLADPAMALVGLLVLSPLFLVIALAIRLNDGGPVFFRQVRIGVRGERFSMFKFRTMVVDAEGHLPQLHDHNEGAGVLFKIRADPRVTRVGRWLRRCSLDELPQLINVARGEMSLVGPRPPLPGEVEQYEPDAVRRLRVRPGMTGLWQISGRSDLSWEESLRLDLRYVDNWSPVVDLQILLRTLRAVVKGAGAY